MEDNIFKSGFVALVGRPNAGKSTLLNACIGEKVAAASPVPQTTRRRLRAIITTDEAQIIIVDTPGIHKPKDALGKELNQAALGELADADVVAHLVDATKPAGTGDAWVAKHVEACSAPYKLLVITKADIATPELVESQIQAMHELVHYDDTLVISAACDFNVDAFLNLVSAHIPEGPKWFPDDMKTDATDEDLVAECVREKLCLNLRQEIPHSIGVRCDSIEYEKDHAVIEVTILVERESQKGIVVGSGGSMVRKVGTEARKHLEYLLGVNIYLDLNVKVQPEWRRDIGEVRRLGYAAGD